ncbi:unnamed protein product, partial [Brassica oleracea]
SHDDQTRPRQRRGRGGTGRQSRDSSHFQDSPSPHSSCSSRSRCCTRSCSSRSRCCTRSCSSGSSGSDECCGVCSTARFNRSGNGISAWINRMMYSALDKGHPTF